eukprot:7638568-Pyramimonas_sp.AAC.2
MKEDTRPALNRRHATTGWLSISSTRMKKNSHVQRPTLRVPGTSFKQHNQALNYWRSYCEDVSRPFDSEGSLFDSVNPTMVQAVELVKGTSFPFRAHEEVPWRWQEMVVTLKEISGGL